MTGVSGVAGVPAVTPAEDSGLGTVTVLEETAPQETVAVLEILQRVNLAMMLMKVTKENN